MHQKRTKYIIILVATFTTIFTISYISFLKPFLENTTYYEPVSIQIQGLNDNQFQSVNCHGISPNGRIINLNKDNENHLFYSNSYVHLNDIIFYCNDSIFVKTTGIEVKFKNKQSPYIIDFNSIINDKDLVETSEIHRHISFKNHISPKHSTIQVLFAIFMWSGLFRLLYIFIISVTILLIVIRHRKYILSLYIKIAPQVIIALSKLDIEKKHIRQIFSLILCVILCIIFFNNTNFTGIKLEIKESTTQTIAVNFAHGHGFPKSGFIETFDNYNITRYHPTGDLTYVCLNEFKGAYSYHNPPIYNLFIGSFYYFAGVNPLLLKQTQLLILIISISLLPFLGFKIAGKIGFWSGLISAPIVLQKYYTIANQLEPYVLIILLLFILTYLFKKSILEEKFHKIVILGLVLSLIILTQLTFILLPIFIFLYLLIKLIKKPNRKTVIGFLFLISSFIIPITIWSQYASNHLNSDLIKNNSFTQVHNILLKRTFDTQDVTILEGLEDYHIIKNNDSIINDAGWVGLLSVYENDLVDNIVTSSLLYNERIIIATKSAPDLLFIAHNEYCTNGNPSADWTKHSDSYYNNDNQSLSPYFRVFLFYLNHPKQLFSGAINKLYNGFSSFNYLFIVIWIYVINSLFFYLQTLLQRKNQKYIRATKIFISSSLLIISFCVVNINYIVFYSTLIALFILILIKTFNRKTHGIKTPEVFILVLLSLLFFVIATFGLEKYIIVIDFIFVYQAIYSLLFFSFSNNNPPNSINT